MKTKKIEYKDGNTLLEGYIAFDENEKRPRPGVLVVHDWTGRNPHAEERAERLTKLGLVGFAVDMYGKGILGKNNDEKSKLAEPFFNNRDLIKNRMLCALTALKQESCVDPKKIAVLGFCFGGMCALDLARSGADIKAAISFHGLLNPPPSGCVTPLNCKILAMHGHDDTMVTPEQVLAFETELTQARADWQVHVYGHTTHAFTNKLANDPNFGTVYNAKADKRSWEIARLFLEEVFSYN